MALYTFSWFALFYKNYDIIGKFWTYHNDSSHCYIKGLTYDIIVHIIVKIIYDIIYDIIEMILIMISYISIWYHSQNHIYDIIVLLWYHNREWYHMFWLWYQTSYHEKYHIWYHRYDIDYDIMVFCYDIIVNIISMIS